MTFRRLSPLPLLLVAIACGPSEREERRLELLLDRPSIRQLGVPTSVSSVSFEYLGGYASFSPHYRLTLYDDDRYLFEGFHDVQRLGPHRGSYEFAPIAAWLEVHSPPPSMNLSLPGAIDFPTFEISIRRRTLPPTSIRCGTPIDDLEVWGLFHVLQGVVAQLDSDRALDEKLSQTPDTPCGSAR